MIDCVTIQLLSAGEIRTADDKTRTEVAVVVRAYSDARGLVFTHRRRVLVGDAIDVNLDRDDR